MNVWNHIIRSIEPEIDNINQHQFRVEAYKILHENSSGVVVYIRPQYAYVDIAVTPMIEWTNLHLANWDTVKRYAYDKWIFSTETDADKFITLFNLKWL